MSLAIVVRSADEECAVLDVAGDIDAYSLTAFHAAVAEQLDRRPSTLLLDFQRVRFIDSAGLGALIVILKRARAYGGFVRIVCTDPRIRKTFEITGLSNLFTMYSDVRTAREGERFLRAGARLPTPLVVLVPARMNR